jgi:hypothetical protein
MILVDIFSVAQLIGIVGAFSFVGEFHAKMQRCKDANWYLADRPEISCDSASIGNVIAGIGKLAPPQG